MINIIKGTKRIVNDDFLEALSRQAGVGKSHRLEAAANDLIAALLLGLCQHSFSDEGADRLAQRLEEDFEPHEEGQAPNRLQDVSAEDGEEIARELFGKQREEIIHSIGRMSGLESAQVEKVLHYIAPIFMSYMARVKRERELDAGGLKRTITYSLKSPEGENAEIFLLEKVLEKNNHTSWVSELQRYGDKFLSSLF